MHNQIIVGVFAGLFFIGGAVTGAIGFILAMQGAPGQVTSPWFMAAVGSFAIGSGLAYAATTNA